MTSEPAERPGTSVRDLLRAATRARHAAVSMIPQMARVLAVDYNLDEYQMHLARLLGFYEPLERLAERTADPQAARHCFRRSEKLRADLAALGWAAPRIAAVRQCTELPMLTPAGIWGYCYVMLGSMLGARIIAQRLDSVPGARPALHFYRGDAAENDRRWASFCRDLERHGTADGAAICATANATFDAYGAWLQDERPQHNG